MLWGSALQGHSGAGHGDNLGVGLLRETLGLGLCTPGRLWGCALQGHFGVGHPRDEEKSSGRGEELSLKSKNPTPSGEKQKGLGFIGFTGFRV